MNEFQNKRVAVIGLARAGVPAVRFLLERGASVVGYDAKARAEIGEELLDLERAGVELRLGDHGFEGIEACQTVVLSPGLKVHFEPLKSVIERVEVAGGEVIGELELASRFCPSPIIAVTGTKGKSTTVKLITEMLLACGVDARAAGNTGTPLISILPQLSEHSWAVVEVSSFQLEKAPTFKPRVAVLLSLLEDHQDYHPTLEQYWETKLKIFANQGDGDSAIYNADDERVEAVALSKEGVRQKETSGRNLGKTQKTDRFVYGWKGRLHCQLSPLHSIPIIETSEIPLQGQHNLSNVAAAVGAVCCLMPFDARIGAAKIAEAIRHFQTLPHRLEVVARRDGVTWVNDSQSTIPDASIAALKAFPAPVSLILGGRAKIGAESYALLMREVHRAKAKIYLFGEAGEMLEGVADRENVEKSSIYRENTLSEVLKVARINSTSGETIVLSPACASFDQFSSYEERGETFKKEVRAP